MSLANTKKRQKLSSDPQNKLWSNDHTKIGYKLLEKMGWSEGKGLGVNENGMTSHLKISLREDNRGVGVEYKYNDNWKDGTSSFDSLLRQLNQQISSDKNSKEVCEKKKERRKKTKTPKSHATQQTLDISTASSAHRFHHRKKRNLESKFVKNYKEEDLNGIFGILPVANKESLEFVENTIEKNKDEAEEQFIKSSKSISEYFSIKSSIKK